MNPKHAARRKATVHLLCGLPGSGKTTWARRLAAECSAVVLNHDERMIARHGPNPPESEFTRFAAAVTEELWREAAGEIAHGRDVILDWGFWTRAERDDARRRGGEIGAACVFYRMRCADDVARRRTLERTAAGTRTAFEINGAAWDLFRAKFEEPTADEGAVEIE
ncbi:MAG: ATP-binding protein [Opitutae bacterium]|nr:ATP-binding protein [Opitutae bacterium]